MLQYLTLDGGSPATAELVQQVVLLNGQALTEVVHDPSMSPDTHAGLDICVLSFAGPTHWHIVCLCGDTEAQLVDCCCSHAQYGIAQHS